jgi:quercetin dioxygenase-like cupin family protein
MKTHTPTHHEMLKRVARFKDLKPVKEQYNSADGIPAEAYSTISADSTYILMGPEGLKSATGETPPVIGGDGGDTYTINAVTCPPGNGSPLHAHHYTCETFYCLNGRFRVSWGDLGEHSIFLDPMDMIAVPPGVTRNFTNVSDKDANLLVLIQGPKDKFQDVDLTPEMGKTIENKFGVEIRKKLELKGLAFTAGLDLPLPVNSL